MSEIVYAGRRIRREQPAAASTGAANDDLSAALRLLKARQPRYRTYRDYYAGSTGLQFISDEFRDAFRHLLDGLSYNRCKRVIGAHADRMRLRGFSVVEGPEDVGTKAAEVWSRNRMDVKLGQLLTESFLLGVSYAMVWPDDAGQAKIHPQFGDRCLVVRDPDDPDRITHALKLWLRADRRWRVNWYTPEGLEKYVTRGRRDDMPEKAQFLDRFQEDNEAWPLPYPKSFQGRVPFFAFPNDPDIAYEGTSELSDVLNRQDHLNKILANRIVAGEAYALPQWYITGHELQRNPDTGTVDHAAFDATSKLWVFASDAVKAGQLDPANVTHLIADEAAVDAEICAVTGVPIHWLNPVTGAPSGESLKTIESPFTYKLIDRQNGQGPNLTDMTAFRVEVDGWTGGAFRLAADWAPPEPRSDKETWEIAIQKQAAGIPAEETWSEAGYSPDEIERFLAAKEEKRQADAEKLAALMAGSEQQRNAGSGFGGAGSDVGA